jgi:hypothetical protein
MVICNSREGAQFPCPFLSYPPKTEYMRKLDSMGKRVLLTSVKYKAVPGGYLRTASCRRMLSGGMAPRTLDYARSVQFQF